MLVGDFNDELSVPPCKDKRPWSFQLRKGELCNPVVRPAHMDGPKMARGTHRLDLLLVNHHLLAAYLCIAYETASLDSAVDHKAVMYGIPQHARQPRMSTTKDEPPFTPVN